MAHQLEDYVDCTKGQEEFTNKSKKLLITAANNYNMFKNN